MARVEITSAVERNGKVFVEGTVDGEAVTVRLWITNEHTTGRPRDPRDD